MIVSAGNEEKASGMFKEISERFGLKYTRADISGNTAHVLASLPDLLDFSGRCFTKEISSSHESSFTPLDPRLKAWGRNGDLEFRVFEGTSDKSQLTIEICAGGIPFKRAPLPEAQSVYNGGPFGHPILSDRSGLVAFIGEAAEVKYPKGWWREPKTGIVDKYEYSASFGESLTKSINPKLFVWDGNAAVKEVKAPAD
jgi:hypothetical protein